MKGYVVIIGLIFLIMLASLARADGPYKIGVYYFPGWRSSLTGAPALQPWDAIKKFPERKPLLGWYDDGDKTIVDTQLSWMHHYGLSFVVFDWYWSGTKPFLNHSIDAYLQAKNRSLVPFAILWANHDDAPRSKSEFTSMVSYWIANYLKKPEFLRFDQKPVVIIFSHTNFKEKAAKFGSTPAQLMAEAQSMAKAAGLPGIYFVSSTFYDPNIANSGYSAMTAYNYHGLDRESESYGDLDGDYQKIWKKVGAQSKIPYFVPMTQGWDRRPWGGSRNAAHDKSAGLPEQFESHIVAGRKFMDEHPQQTKKVGIICCWNEFGEGSYIEPTETYGFKFLQSIHSTFVSSPAPPNAVEVKRLTK